MTQIGSVYAQALYSLASEEKLTERVLEEITAFNQSFSAEPDFIRLLSTPNLSKEDRLKIIDDSFQGKAHPYVLNFMKILTEKGYMRHFSDCCEAYRACYNEAHGILPVRAVTAAPLTEAQAAKLTEKLAKMLDRRVELINVVDPACLGGVRLDYDGKRVDDTVEHRLNAVHSMLKNTVL